MNKLLLYILTVGCIFTTYASPLEAIENPPVDLFACEEGNGFATFDLTQNDAIVLGSQNPTDFNITYHLTQADADSDVAPIPNPTTFTSSDAIIFVRVEELANTDLFEIGVFNVIVESQPLIFDPNNIILCNDDSSSSDPTGITTFNLTVFEDEITGGDPTLTVSYFESQADLNAGISIVDPTAYTNVVNPQTISVLVATTVGCTAQTSFELEVLPLPQPGEPDELSICDNASDGDDSNGIVEFDLTQTVSIIEGGESVTINIFDDFALAEQTPFDPSNIVTTIGSTGEILYTNTIPGGQTLYARIDSSVSILPDGTACFVIVEINLIVANCIDTDNDGVPDEEEDLNNNGDLEDDDTDNDDIPNYLDDDDDGDSVMTIDEITGIGAGVAPQDFIDTDDDTIENYLDDDDDGDTVLTRDEDYNNSGSPLDDDTNDNGVPDFLDPDVALSTDEFTVTNFKIYPNPAIDHITITGTMPFEKMSIYDITGKLLLEQTEAPQVTQTLTLPVIKRGMYFIRIDNQSTIMRFIKR